MNYILNTYSTNWYYILVHEYQYQSGLTEYMIVNHYTGDESGIYYTFPTQQDIERFANHTIECPVS